MSNIKIFPTFPAAFKNLSDRMLNESFEVQTEKWQGMSVIDKPEARMRELLFPTFQVLVPTESLGELAGLIGPNLPWADKHFELERVSGEPLNPGQTWKEWPWGNSADKFRNEGEQFSHSYAERYWPKRAGLTQGGKTKGISASLNQMIRYLNQEDIEVQHGIRYPLGDLMDVVTLLATQPLTRQAYLPVFFPEDTGAVHGGRIPCSIGYHFILRGGALHMVYQLRSCDFYRHFRDDVYLSVRLLLWVLDRLREADPATWKQVKPGLFTMTISSLHMFVNDYRAMFKDSL